MSEDTFTTTEDGAAAHARVHAIDLGWEDAPEYEPDEEPAYEEWEPDPDLVPEHLVIDPASQPRPEDLPDGDLPGMWSQSDFTGGDPDERSYTDRGWVEGHDDNSASERGSHWEDPE